MWSALNFSFLFILVQLQKIVLEKIVYMWSQVSTMIFICRKVGQLDRYNKKLSSLRLKCDFTPYTAKLKIKCNLGVSQ